MASNLPGCDLGRGKPAHAREGGWGAQATHTSVSWRPISWDCVPGARQLRRKLTADCGRDADGRLCHYRHCYFKWRESLGTLPTRGELRKQFSREQIPRSSELA